LEIHSAYILLHFTYKKQESEIKMMINKLITKY